MLAREWWENPKYLSSDVHVGDGFDVIRAISPNEVWMLGPEGHLARFDGLAWSRVNKPARDGCGVNGVIARTPQDIWLVGHLGYSRYDGKQWTSSSVTEPGVLTIHQIARTLDGTMLRIDWVKNGESEAALQLRSFDPSTQTWKALGPKLDAGNGRLWAAGADNVYFISDDDTLWRFDGLAWASAPGTYWDIHGSAADNIWAVTLGGALHRWDGAAWTKLVLAPDDDTRSAYSVWTDGKGHGFVGGDGKVYEVNGTVVTVHDLPGEQMITRLAGSATNLYAGGGSTTFYTTPYGDAVEEAFGFVAHYDGSSWKVQISGADSAVSGLDVDSTGRAWLQSSHGVLSHP